MTEIQKTLQTLKARYPEVALIIGLNVLALLSAVMTLKDLPAEEEAASMQPATTVFLVFAVAAAILSVMLKYGFMRTVYLEGDKHCQPGDLLKTGRPFFWRIVGLGLLATAALLILQYPAMAIEQKLASGGKEHSIFITGYSIVVMLILMKPILLMPVLIVVLDCRILQSWALLKRLRLLDAKVLIVLFCIQIAIGLVWQPYTILQTKAALSDYVITILAAIAFHFLALLAAVTAIRFVASSDLVYHPEMQQPKDRDFPDS